MNEPQLWLNGQQLTGYASDRAPVLANVEIEWGSTNDLEPPSPDSFTFSVLFRDGVHTIPGLTRGAEVEITVSGETVAAGRIRTANAAVGSLEGSLQVNVACPGHHTDLEETYISPTYPEEKSSTRWVRIQNEFTEQGWILTPHRWNAYRETQTVYNSIKLLTVLNRFLSANGSVTFADLSSRRNGVLIKQIDVFPRPASAAPNALRSATNGNWYIEYTTRSNTGSLVEIDGGNTLLPTWQLEPGTAINSVKISSQRTRLEDGLPVTDLTDSVRNDNQSIALIGKNAVDIEISAGPLEPADLQTIAESWYRPDSGWNVEEIQIRDADLMTNTELKRILSARYRSRTLVIISRVLVKQPDPAAASNIRAALLGGRYRWTGNKWELTLTLGRNQVFSAENQYSFFDIGNSQVPGISQGTAASIGRDVSFADFRQITRSI